ncbi:MAG: hypothetical protein JSV86_13230 [Gemmatimonadota bacterium]|nr:MAG: hypothetical protein JSV86_13230 [Gemmatimonadota bacterium]
MDIVLVCPHCDDDVDIPEGCRYGGSFIVPCCDEIVHVAYEQTIDVARDRVTELWALRAPGQGD